MASMHHTCIITLVLFGFTLVPTNAQKEARASILCRPDQFFQSSSQKCITLKRSISDLVREILENSDSSLAFLHYHSEMLSSNRSASLKLPSRVPLTDLFVQHLAMISEGNLTTCLSLASCNEHCYSWPERTGKQKEHEESVVNRFLTPLPTHPSGRAEALVEEEENSTPDFVRLIMSASKRGISYGKKQRPNGQNQCSMCQKDYVNCPASHYAYVVRMNSIFRRMVEANVTFVNKEPALEENRSPEMLYYHFSMHFLDLANLTSCYAQVSCENTCEMFRATIAEHGAELVEPPPKEGQFLKGDPKKAPAIDTIHLGAYHGYELALQGHCDRCHRQYPDCTPEHHEIGTTSAVIFGN